jgi:hypothetical protein
MKEGGILYLKRSEIEKLMKGSRRVKPSLSQYGDK